MDLNIYDIQRNAIGVIEGTESLIWADRYIGYGDFEVTVVPSDKNLELMVVDNFVELPEHSDRWMIIERVVTVTDPDEGNKLRVSGRSLESILTRRRVVGRNNSNIFLGYLPRTYWPTVWDALKDGAVFELLDGTVNASSFHANYPGFYTLDPTDQDVLDLLMSSDLSYSMEKNCYDVTMQICKEHNLGFKTTVDPETKNIYFTVYLGQDRSYSQSVNPHVIFSPEYDNLLSAEFVHDVTEMKNCTLTAYKTWVDKANYPDLFVYHPWAIDEVGETIPPQYTGWGTEGYKYGLREAYYDAENLSQLDPNGDLIPTVDYELMLFAETRRLLKEERSTLYRISGKADTSNSNFKYREDFFLGDIVQIEDDFGHSGQSRITEVIISEELEEFGVFPTFEPME